MAADIQVFEDSTQLGRAAAERICAGIATAAKEGRRYLLGCPGGRTARSTYTALAALVAERGQRLDHVVIAMMDDYVEAHGGGYRRISAEAHNSCRGFAEREIVAPLTSAARTPLRPEHLWLPDPADPSGYDDRIADAGGIDLFLLASGESDGHVAFNPPGTAATSGTRVVRLAETTRQDNLNTFPQYRSIAEVPTHGVTVGIRTISEFSKQLVMLVVGAHKATAFRRLAGATTYDATWPATVVHLGRDAVILADRAAAGPVVTGTGERPSPS